MPSTKRRQRLKLEKRQRQRERKREDYISANLPTYLKLLADQVRLMAMLCSSHEVHEVVTQQ